MYVGRIVAIGRNAEGRAAALYRVSSRSFPNRTASVGEGAALIVPREGHESDVRKNPYIAYRCLRVVGDTAVITNGSQTDPIAEKIGLGMEIREALASVLLALDYEKDDYNTPRIAAVIRAGADSGFLGVVRHDGLEVRELAVAPGQALYVATYEINSIDPQRVDAFEATDAEAGARHVVDGGAFADLTHPVTSVCAMETVAGFEAGAFTVS